MLEVQMHYSWQQISENAKRYQSTVIQVFQKRLQIKERTTCWFGTLLEELQTLDKVQLQ